ncbi:MAG: hypothetical protein M1444_02735 [Patescibacteria group bacterium]|nr:hypothetical protein [Patescibacteria group bacterium]
MQRRIEALRQDGLVLEGQHPDIHDVSISSGGQSTRLEVRPLVARRADLTVLRPVSRTMASGQEYRV